MTANRLVYPAKLPVFVALVFAALCVFPAPVAKAQELPRLATAYPKDIIVYGEISLTGAIRAAYDLDAWTAGGAIGLSYKDFAAVLKTGGLPIDEKELRPGLAGVKRLSGALVDINIDATPTWLTVMDHDSPQALISILERLNEAKLIVFKKAEVEEERSDVREYELQVPTNWVDEVNPFARGWWWGSDAKIDKFSDPLRVAVWKSRYVLVSASASIVADALEALRFPGDTEFSLAGGRLFMKDYSEEQDADVFLHWNINIMLKKLEQLAEGRGVAEFDDVSSLGELKLFRSFVMSARYDGDVGATSWRARLNFFSAPSWMAIVQVPPKPAPLTDFCPEKPAFFMATSIDSPEALFDRVITYAKTQMVAVGRPQDVARIERDLDEVKEKLGFGISDGLAQLGSSHAIFVLPPFDGMSNPTRSTPACFVMEVKDAAAAEKFLNEKLRSIPDLREQLHLTAERVYLDFGGGKRASYTVYDTGDEASFAYGFAGNCLAVGTQHGVRAAMTAKMTGKNLQSDGAWQNFRKNLPPEGLVTAYSDLSFLATHASAIFKEQPASDEDYYRSARFRGLEEEQARPTVYFDDDTPSRLTASIFKKHLANLRAGGVLQVGDKTIEATLRLEGMPTTAGWNDTAIMIAAFANRQNARTRLAREIAPAVQAYLFEHSDLPETAEEFATTVGKPAILRDPSLAGPAVEAPDTAQSFVWLGRHGKRPLQPCVPLAHSAKPDVDEKVLVLMSDGSVHRVTMADKDKALAAAANAGEKPPLKSNDPQTLDDALKALAGGMMMPEEMFFDER